MKMIPGNQLTLADQNTALGLFLHRYTGDHKPGWARRLWKDGRPYPLQFKSDQEWLLHTRFNVNRYGRLFWLAAACESSPTWPNNPELRKP